MIKQEIKRFLLVGGTTVLIDFLTYIMLSITLQLNTEISKGISFSLGGIFAYYTNKIYTFNNAKGGNYRFIFFVTLYLMTLYINVTTNKIILYKYEYNLISISLAFLFATGISASINFIGMKIIFSYQRGK